MAIIKQIKDSEGTVHDIIDTTYSVVGTNGSTGLIKNGSTVTSSSGYTACPIVSGVPYYKDTNTHYTSKNIVGTSATASSNGAVTENGVYLNHLEESNIKSTHKITGSGSVKVTSNASGNITITGTDTTYSAGTNVTITNGVISANDTTYQVFTSTANGLVPKTSSTTTFLKGDGTWATPTNTKNTAGATTTTSKIYLIGATSQGANPQTYTHSTVYADTDHSLHASAFYETSDERLKTFTEDYDVNLDSIKNIKTGRFYWNSDENKVINGGVSAQTVEEYFPELVRENEDGIKSVNYDGLAVVAIAAIKKLTERIEQLEDIIRNK